MTPQQVAAAENRAVRIAWGEPPDGRTAHQKTIAERVRPFLGQGLSRREVADRIRCTPRSVGYALEKIGGAL
ncbi:hypothetical protein DSM109990_01305 [Sulfitobacter dubius]|uniref:Homeodomain-like domain-containing protein n=1 Tax=Sulfitobacter dubius TaxID=218673 RepID=A0ABY3ZK25_9RHOB|nr:hypothetical protein DSM109990_01305 [Sulfitobacter dubius]